MAYRRSHATQGRIDEQRQALLDAATRLLAEDGYAGCSVVAVAGRAGVATGSVYRHFVSKQALVAEVFRFVVGRELGAVHTAIAAHEDPLERMAAVVQTFAGRALKTPKLAYALLAEPVDPQVDQLRRQFRSEFRDLIAEIVDAGVHNGSLPPQPRDVVAAALVGAIGEALVGPLAVGIENADTVPALILFAHRALGVVHANS